MNNLPVFEDFARKHGVFVVKPADCSFGIGVHKVHMDFLMAITKLRWKIF